MKKRLENLIKECEAELSKINSTFKGGTMEAQKFLELEGRKRFIEQELSDLLYVSEGEEND